MVGTANAQHEHPPKSIQVKNPKELILPAGANPPKDPELKDLSWNRWTTDNFTILSIDYGQGKWLADNIEKIKTWSLTRWGFPDLKFSNECRIFCVPNKSLLKKLFRLDESKVEIRRGDDGKIDISAIWLVLDKRPAVTVPVPLTLVCLAEFEEKHNVKMGFWSHRGIAQLNGTFSQIRSSFGQLNKLIKNDEPIYFSKVIFAVTEEQYKNSPKNHQEVFDVECVALCLFLRKEFGEAKLQGFLRISAKNDTENVLKLIYSFDDYDQFDVSLFRYMRDLSSDIVAKKTPDNYLNIKSVK